MSVYLNKQNARVQPHRDEIIAMAGSLLDLDYSVIHVRTPEDIRQLPKNEDAKFIIAVLHSNSPLWDNIKERFFELGLVGGDSVGHEPIWFGVTEPLAEGLSKKKCFPLFASYYTRGTGYEEAAVRLQNTLEKFGLDYEIIGIEPRESWEQSCAYKPDFIRDVWRKSKRPVVWLDADATVEAYPSLFYRTGADFAFHKWRGVEFSTDNEKFGWELASGTLFFNQSNAAEALLNSWCEKCAVDPMLWDQVHLDSAWAEANADARGPLKTLFLPQRYLQILDRPDRIDQGGPIIKHWQASRHLKAGASGGIMRPKHKVEESFVRARRYARFSHLPES